MSKKIIKNDNEDEVIELSQDDTNFNDISDDLVVVKNYNFREFIVNLDSEIKEVSQYRKAFHVLSTASPNDIVRVIINTPGGLVDTALQFHNMLLNTQARTIAEVYNAHSAGSMVMLSCDNIQMMRYSSVMIHSVSFGIGGKVGDVKAYADFTSDSNKAILDDIYAGFLSEKEIESIVNNKDIWLTKQQCEERLKTWVPIRARNSKKDICEEVKEVKSKRSKK